MTEIRGLYTLWLREVKRYLRDRVRILSSFFQPLLWLVIFGSGIRFAGAVGNLTTQQYIFPGIIGQTLLFTSMFMGISVIWDREFGFLKEILVAPISRFSIFLGKMLGDSTDAVIQGVIVFVFGLLLGMKLNLLIFLEALPVMMLITFGLVSIGLTIASFIENLESFGVVQSFVNLPLFFLSGALFPVRGPDVPSWLQTISSFNPLTYGVDALRTIILGDAWTPLEPLYFDLAVIIGFNVVMIIIGTFAFSRRK
ncbi:MAG TPA: ABC transporter permease [Candidatus Eisenbacteria bacterium]|jgi:ABC-2 type transport system permease protein|nr:ABC transporter permease [Candidatus Eisenbacteria bacterium]